MSGIVGYAISNPNAFAENEKVTICHKPGTPAEETITISENAVQAHLDHGDFVGTCETPPPPSGNLLQCFCGDQGHTVIEICTATVSCDDIRTQVSRCATECQAATGTSLLAGVRCASNACVPSG